MRLMVPPRCLLMAISLDCALAAARLSWPGERAPLVLLHRD